MTNYTFSLITPSYAPDFERCRLLAESVDRCSLYKVAHYVIVDQKDLQLFKTLENEHRKIITVESILPWWIKKIPFAKNGWFSFKTMPIRNWIIQQIVKLEIANHVSEDILIFVDSDVAFIRPFDCNNFVKEGKVALFRETFDGKDNLPNPVDNHGWQKTTNSLLGLGEFRGYGKNEVISSYVSNFVIWKRDNVLKLHQHIESITGEQWIKSITKFWMLSEYMVYGFFVDRILKEDAGHFWDSEKTSHEYWGTLPLKGEELTQFFHDIPENLFCCMISAKAKMPVSSYEKFIRQMWLDNPHE